jgi:hypothetical protein
MFHIIRKGKLNSEEIPGKFFLMWTFSIAFLKAIEQMIQTVIRRK